MVGAAKAEQHLRRDLKPAQDPSACGNDISSFGLAADHPWNPCGFPLVIAGFGVSGLPPVADPGCVGKNPNIGFYRVGDNLSCDPISASYIAKGAGYRFEAPEGEFTWEGSLIFARPPGQTSLDPDFPDHGQGGIWEGQGRVTFKDGEDYVLVKYLGTKLLDICDILRD